MGNGSLLGVEQVSGKGQRGEGKASVHEALRSGHLRDGGARDLVHVGVPQRPVVHVHSLHSAEPVQALKVIHRGGEGVHCLQEGVIGELQRWVKRNGRWQGLAPHLPDGSGGVQEASPFFQVSEAGGRKRKVKEAAARRGTPKSVQGREGDTMIIIQSLGDRAGHVF